MPGLSRQILELTADKANFENAHKNKVILTAGLKNEIKHLKSQLEEEKKLTSCLPGLLQQISELTSDKVHLANAYNNEVILTSGIRSEVKQLMSKLEEEKNLTCCLPELTSQILDLTSDKTDLEKAYNVMKSKLEDQINMSEEKIQKKKTKKKKALW